MGRGVFEGVGRGVFEGVGVGGGDSIDAEGIDGLHLPLGMQLAQTMVGELFVLELLELAGVLSTREIHLRRQLFT